MFRQLIKIILIGPIIAIGLWMLISGVEIQEVLPSGVGGVVMLNHPIDSVEKIAGSELLQSLSKRGETEQIKELLNFLEKMRGREPMFTFYQMLFKKVYFAVPADLTRQISGPIPFAIYVDTGLVGRMISFFGNHGFFRFSDQVAEHRGFALIRRNREVVAYVRNYMIIGSMTQVVQAIDAFEGGISSLQDIEERYRNSLAAVDQAADISAVLLSSSYFRKADSDRHLFDPRLFLEATAIGQAVANVYIEDEGLSARLIVKAKPGKLVSPYTVDKPGEFRTIFLPDADTFLYAALRLERPADLSALLFDMFTSDREVSKLRKKLTVLLFNSFLEYMGQEIAVVMDYENLIGFPVIVFEVNQTEKIQQLLAKYAKAKDAQQAMREIVVKDTGQKLVDAMLAADNEQQVQALLNMVPDEQREQVAVLVQKLRAGLIGMDEIQQDQRQINLFGRTLYYRLVGDRLVLAPTSEAANRYEKNLSAQIVQPEYAAENRQVPVNGPLLGWLNLAVPLSKSDPKRESYEGWLATKKPRLLVGSQVVDGKMLITVQMPIELGLTSIDAQPSLLWLMIIYSGLFILSVLYFFLLYIFLKAILILVWPSEDAKRRSAN